MKTFLSIASLLTLASLGAQSWSQVGNGDNLTGPTANVWMLHSNPNQSELYIGGCFDSVNNNVSRHIGLWNPSGFSPMQSGMTQGGQIVVLCAETYNGNTYCGGKFTTANGIPCQNIAVWDGSQWSTVGNGLTGSIVALEEFAGHLYARTSTSLFALVDNEWVDLNVKSCYQVGYLPVYRRGMAVYNNELYVGAVDSAGGINMNGIARWNGIQWNNVGQGIWDGTSTSVFISAMCVYGTELYVGGDFTVAGTSPASNIARWNGTNWSPLAGGLNQSVMSLDTVDGKLAVGGWFWLADGIPVDHIAFWQSTTGVPENNEDALQIGFDATQSTIQINGPVLPGTNRSVCNSLGQEVASFQLDVGPSMQQHMVDVANGIYVVNIYSKDTMLASRKILVSRL